ncbi:hypothetical protein ACQPX6_08375 [Actinomycetospora sp. CA-101289]|uniref:hypothetical protein n=1 Tax=Actinomycetospora sp. CA-101289 TaxID=3239893 RepID=UPI003D97872D
MVTATIALLAWVLTALGGFVMLGRWVARGGVRQQRTGASRLPAGVVFSHLALAAAGLVLWVLHLLLDDQVLGWIALALLVPVAALGFAMLARWRQVRRAPAVASTAAARHGAAPGSPSPSGAGRGEETPAERHLPVAVVVAHGVLAVATVVLVLLAMLAAGGS